LVRLIRLLLALVVPAVPVGFRDKLGAMAPHFSHGHE
jgi:hypothetical protein